MARSYKTATATFNPNVIYKSPIDVMSKVMSTHQSRLDKQQEGLGALGDLLGKATSAEEEKDLLLEGKEKYRTEIDEITSAMNEDPSSYMKYKPRIDELSKNLKRDFDSTGLFGQMALNQDAIAKERERIKNSGFDDQTQGEMLNAAIKEWTPGTAFSTNYGFLSNQSLLGTYKYNNLVSTLKTLHRDTLNKKDWTGTKMPEGRLNGMIERVLKENGVSPKLTQKYEIQSQNLIRKGELDPSERDEFIKNNVKNDINSLKEDLKNNIKYSDARQDKEKAAKTLTQKDKEGLIYKDTSVNFLPKYERESLSNTYNTVKKDFMTKDEYDKNTDTFLFTQDGKDISFDVSSEEAFVKSLAENSGSNLVSILNYFRDEFPEWVDIKQGTLSSITEIIKKGKENIGTITSLSSNVPKNTQIINLIAAKSKMRNDKYVSAYFAKGNSLNQNFSTGTKMETLLSGGKINHTYKNEAGEDINSSFQLGDRKQIKLFDFKGTFPGHDYYKLSIPINIVKKVENTLLDPKKEEEEGAIITISVHKNQFKDVSNVLNTLKNG